MFIWDSLAMTPTITDVEGDFNPQSTMAMKARILSKGMSKLTIPIANTKVCLPGSQPAEDQYPTGTERPHRRNDDTVYHPRRKGYALCIFSTCLADGAQGEVCFHRG